MLIYMTYKTPSGEWQNLSAWQSIEELTNFFIGLEPKEYKISFAPEHGPAILKAIRLAKGFDNATAFAKSMLGVNKQRLYEYESGKRFSLDTITKLAESLNQKVMISLEGTSDFTTELAPPKDLYDGVELDDFEPKKQVFIDKYIDGKLINSEEAADLKEAIRALETIIESIDNYTWIYAENFNANELGEEVPVWFTGDGVYNQNHELIYEKDDLSIWHDNILYAIRETPENNGH